MRFRVAAVRSHTVLSRIYRLRVLRMRWLLRYSSLRERSERPSLHHRVLRWSVLRSRIRPDSGHRGVELRRMQTRPQGSLRHPLLSERRCRRRERVSRRMLWSFRLHGKPNLLFGFNPGRQCLPGLLRFRRTDLRDDFGVLEQLDMRPKAGNVSAAAPPSLRQHRGLCGWRCLLFRRIQRIHRLSGPPLSGRRATALLRVARVPGRVDMRARSIWWPKGMRVDRRCRQRFRVERRRALGRPDRTGPQRGD